MIEYTKYKEHGDIHWKWYSTEGHNYKKLVDSAIAPLSDIEENCVILDIGSGDGLVDSLLIDKSARVIGLDPNEEGVAIAAEKLAEKHGWGATTKFLPILLTLEEFVESEDFSELEDNEFDYLFSLNTIEHTDKPELYRDVMKKVKNFGIIVTDDKTKSGTASKFHNREFTIDELKELFDGFGVEEIPIDHESFIGIKVWNMS